MSDHASKQYDLDLGSIRSRVLAMGGLVESQIRRAIDALASGDLQLSDEVIAADHKVNALEVGDGLHDGEDHAQVAGRRLAAHDELAAVAVDRDFHRVDAMVGFDHLIGKREIAGGERVDRAADLRLDQPAHRQHARADRAQVEVVLLGGVLVQPNLPVM